MARTATVSTTKKTASRAKTTLGRVGRPSTAKNKVMKRKARITKRSTRRMAA